MDIYPVKDHFYKSLNKQIDFKKYSIDYKNNIFNEVIKNINFEQFGQHRQCTVIVDYDEINKIYPLNRTTTIYKKPAQKFQEIHYNIIENIKKISNINNLQLNNALIEIYGDGYKTMGYHSDQALDLADESYICLVTFYANNQKYNMRQLQIKNKTSGIEQQISLDHNSVIIFSTQTNKLYQHKIILPGQFDDVQNKWLGVTFRLSKTYIQFINEIPYFYKTNDQLIMINDDQIKQFYINRQQENREINYEQQQINYTISPSDLLVIK